MTGPTSVRGDLPILRVADGCGAGWLVRFLRRVGALLESAPAGTALLIEQQGDGAHAELSFLPFSPEVLAVLDATRPEFPIRWRRELAGPASEPPSELAATGSYLARVCPVAIERDDGTEFGGRRSPRPPSEELARRGDSGLRPEIGVRSGPTFGPPGLFWCAVQTHWVVDAKGFVRVSSRWRLAARSAVELGALELSVAEAVRRRCHAVGTPPWRIERLRATRWRTREWRSGALRWWRGRPAAPLPSHVAAELALVLPVPPDARDEPLLRHGALLGASGSGKTGMLASVAREALLEGRSVVLFDVHGDLAPRFAASLPPAVRRRLVAVDAGAAAGGFPGFSVFGPTAAKDQPAAVAHLVAALKRLTPDGTEIYWGFRMERLFETFLRIVQESDGDLVDLWSLLTDRRRREAARLATTSPDDARFLEDLEVIVRRQPDFLWPAAARVAKVTLSPKLSALLAPREGDLPVLRLLETGRSVAWRLPLGELGPEGVAFAATLLLTRVYLELVRSAPRFPQVARLRVLFVVDEAHLFPPRLLTEIVSEGRKFGLGILLATQYAERLAPELRAAVAGAAGTVSLFRVPWASAASTGAWAGLSRTEAEALLPALPTGWFLRCESGPSAERRLERAPLVPAAFPDAWSEAAIRSAQEFAPATTPVEGRAASRDEATTDALLLGLVALEAEKGVSDRAALLRWVVSGTNEPIDPAEALRLLPTLLRRGWVRSEADQLSITPAGAERIGFSNRTDATPETAEHRSLLLEAFRLFARHRERLEILRQGRFDTRLPDGRVRLLPVVGGIGTVVPRQMARVLDRRRNDWIWRAFGGRDVFVEAEVSGALRRERIRHDWTKARRAGAHLLCLVADARRARRVRETLRSLGAERSDWTVWTLPQARGPGAAPPG